MHIIAFHHTLQAVWIRACKHSLILLASRQESLHWLPFPAPRKWLMHLVYIITNVLFALQLNCDCYVQSMGKGHGIAPASALMEKSMRIHFNHCGCGRMSTTLRDCQWPGNYRCLYRFLLWQFRYPQISQFLAPQLYRPLCGINWRMWAVTALIVRLSVRLALWKWSELYLFLLLVVTLSECCYILYILCIWRSVLLAESKSCL